MRQMCTVLYLSPSPHQNSLVNIFAPRRIRTQYDQAARETLGIQRLQSGKFCVPDSGFLQATADQDMGLVESLSRPGGNLTGG